MAKSKSVKGGKKKKTNPQTPKVHPMPTEPTIPASTKSDPTIPVVGDAPVDTHVPSPEIPVHTEANKDATPVSTKDQEAGEPTAEQKNGDAPADDDEGGEGDDDEDDKPLDLEGKSFSELKEIATEKGIDLKGLNSAAKLIEAINGGSNEGDDLYHVTITMNGEDYTASTDNLRDALLALNPPTIKTKVFFKVEHKGKEVTKLLFVPQARRVFLNKLSAEFFAANIIKTLNLK